MLNMLVVAIVFIIILLAIIIIVRNHPDFWFWIFLNLYFDPGGYVYGFLGGTLFGPLHITDIFISGMLVCLISAQVNWTFIFQDKFLRKFLFLLIIFALYFYIAYGGIVPYFHNDLNYKTFFIKNRTFAYGFIILIAVYVFSLRGLFYFYTVTIVVGIICLNLFIISVLSGIELIPISQMVRYEGEKMMRIGMLSYGLFYSLFPISLIVYLLSKKINITLKYRAWLYYSGVLMIITLLLTLTRRTQIDIIAIVLLISLLIAYVFRTSKFTTILKVLAPAAVVIIVLSFTFPNYVGYIAEIGEDTFLLMTTGMDSRGQTDQRVTGTDDYKITLEYINENLLFGTGYTHLSWEPGYASSPRGRRFSIAADAAGEVPIYYLFFGFGLAGAALLIPLYFIMGELFFKLIKILRTNIANYFFDPLTLIYSFYVVLTIAGKFTYNFYNLSLDFSAPNIGSTAVFMGLGFAIYRKISMDIISRKLNIN